MTQSTKTTFDAALKQIYVQSYLHKSVYQNRPMLGILPKFEGFEGRNMPIPNIYGDPQGRSASFTTAQTNTTATKVVDFLIDIVDDYSIVHTAGNLIARTRTNKGAFLKALKNDIDRAISSLSNSLESAIPRSGTGSIGVVGSVSTDTVTLATTADAKNFEPGMEIVASSADGGALRDSGNANTVTEVNRRDGTITADTNWTSAISGFTTSDFLYVEGDAANGGSNVKVSGFQAWLPSTAPTSGDSFFGVDRSVDSRLYGSYYDGSSDTMEEALIEGQSVASSEEGNPDVIIMNHTKMRKLVKELGAKKEHAEVNSVGPKGLVANVGYRGIVIQGDSGEMRAVAANKCPDADGFALERKNWVLVSTGPAVTPFDFDGNSVLRQHNADGIEGRIVFRGQVACKNPVGSCRINLPS